MRFDVDVRLLLTAAALALRLSLVVGMLPLFEQRNVPVIWRLSLAAVLAGALAPAVVAYVPPTVMPLDAGVLLEEAVRSLVIGALFAFAINFAFTAVIFAGSLSDLQIGFGIVNHFDPFTNSQISIIAQVFYLVAVLLFFAVDGHHVVLRALMRSCELMPPFAPVELGAGAMVVVREYGQIFGLGLRLASPVVLVLLLVHAAMGVIVKTAPQIHVMVVGFPIQIAVGLFVVGVSMAFFKSVILEYLVASGNLLDRVLMAL